MKAINEFFLGMGEATWVDWMWLSGHVFLIVLITAVAREIAKRLLNRFAKKVGETQTRWDDALFFAANKPLSWTIWVVGLSFAGNTIYDKTLPLETADTIETADSFFQHVGTIRSAAIVALVAWFATRFIKEFQKIVVLPGHDGTDSRWDPATAGAIGKVLRASVTISAALMILQAFGLPIQGVLAFGGIGGIAVGFAAKDLLANFFGALMLFIDKPFAVGDWIRSPDREIEGTVEEIGWRITRIRTFDQRPLYVPNAAFANLSVENPQRMRNRRIYETFGVRYEDISSVQKVIDDVREMLKSHSAIDTSRTLMVNLVSYGDYSVNFFVYTFTKTTVWTEFHEIKEEILLLIADIVHKHGADFAFPTQTLHLENEITPES